MGGDDRMSLDHCECNRAATYGRVADGVRRWCEGCKAGHRDAVHFTAFRTVGARAPRALEGRRAIADLEAILEGRTKAIEAQAHAAYQFDGSDRRPAASNAPPAPPRSSESTSHTPKRKAAPQSGAAAGSSRTSGDGGSPRQHHPDGPPPKGWSVATSKSTGKPYYYNPATGKSSYSMPGGPPAKMWSPGRSPREPARAANAGHKLSLMVDERESLPPKTQPKPGLALTQSPRRSSPKMCIQKIITAEQPEEEQQEQREVARREMARRHARASTGRARKPVSYKESGTYGSGDEVVEAEAAEVAEQQQEVAAAEVAVEEEEEEEEAEMKGAADLIALVQPPAKKSKKHALKVEQTAKAGRTISHDLTGEEPSQSTGAEETAEKRAGSTVADLPVPAVAGVKPFPKPHRGARSGAAVGRAARAASGRLADTAPGPEGEKGQGGEQQQAGETGRKRKNLEGLKPRRPGKCQQPSKAQPGDDPKRALHSSWPVRREFPL